MPSVQTNSRKALDTTPHHTTLQHTTLHHTIPHYIIPHLANTSIINSSAPTNLWSPAVISKHQIPSEESIVQPGFIVWVCHGHGVMEAGYYCHHTSVSLHSTGLPCQVILLNSPHFLSSNTARTATCPDTPGNNYLTPTIT